MPLKLRRGKRHGNESLYTAHIKLLDCTVLDINLSLSAKGKDCLEKISQKLGLQEIEYFGLQLLTKKEKLKWVDLDKVLRKQLGRYAAHRGPNALLVLKVQYFVVNIHSLRQEITRYLFYLQLKTLVLNGRLRCDVKIALRLAAFAVQAELGDYDPMEHPSDYLSEFLLIPNYLTEGEDFEELNKEMKILHKDNSGLTPGQAERAYIQLCQQLDGYGVEVYNAKNKNGDLINIGPCCAGIKTMLVNREHPKWSLYKWQDINNMAFNRQQFTFSTVENPENIALQMDDMDSAKLLWKTCVNQHQFFRMSNGNVGRTAYRVHQEVPSDSNVFKTIQQSPTIARRLTLTKKRLKEMHHSDESPKTSKGSDSSSDAGKGRAVNIPVVDDMDDTEFLHRYEDICALQRRNSSTSRGSSTAASSDYNTSDSESEADSREFRVQPIAPPVQASSMSTNFRPVSLIFTRLSKIENQHRDQLLRHLEGLYDDNELEEEFEQVFKKKVTSKFTAAVENMGSNRCGNVLPYDENRILLNPKNNNQATSYVNASPIKMKVGKSTLSFIVAQSPLEETVNTFWQMIWENNVCVIVMVSKEEESGVSKCWQYWPDDGKKANTLKFGQVIVTRNFTNFFAAYSIRSFQVQHAASNEYRTVFQIQYIQWPDDGGVPMWTKHFIEFLDEIHSIRKVSSDINGHVPKQETLVHCHNGGGRSGIVVLVEVLLSVIEANEALDIPLTLAHLRSQRMNLIESTQEYIFIYQLLIDYLKRNRLI